MSPGLLAPLLGALAGVSSVLAVRELLGESSSLAAWVRITLEPLRRARSEGYLPDSRERSGIAVLAVCVAVASGLLLGHALLACRPGPLGQPWSTPVH